MGDVNTITGVFMERRQKERGRKSSRNDVSRDCANAVTAQPVPRTARTTGSLEAPRRDSSLEPAEGAQL